MTKPEHVILVDGGGVFCRHCGANYAPAIPAPINILTATYAAFDKTHRGCKLDATRGVACSFCFRFGHDEAGCTRVDYQGDAHAWLRGPDTGLSSKTIWRFMMGVKYGDRDSYPYDPADFGRCYRLLKAFPEWRARIGEMATVAGWRLLVEHWDELERLYEEEFPSGRAPKLYARMRELERRRTSARPGGDHG